jgi:hypothetical protein
MSLMTKDTRGGFSVGDFGSDRVVRPLGFVGEDRMLAAALKEGRPGAMEAFYDRYAPYVQRILVRIVHVDLDISELLQEVFLEAPFVAKPSNAGERL